MTWMEWYNSLPKPSWTPPPPTISLIWMLLYPIILVSFGFVFVKAFQGKVSRRVALPFARQPRGQHFVHADLRRIKERAACGCGHRDRLDDDYLAGSSDLAGL